MIDMDKYKNVQNPHLYQQLLEEERKRQAKIAQTKTSSTNFYNAMHNISGGQTKATPSIPSKESVLNAMKRAQSTNTYINLYSQAMQNGYIKSSAKAPEPTTKKTDEKTETPGGKQTFKIPGVKGVRWVYVPRGDGTGYSIQKPIYEEDYDPLAEELTEEEIQERVLQAFNARNNATSSNQFNYYNSLLFEGRYQLPEPKGVKNKKPDGEADRGENGTSMLGDPTEEQIEEFLKATKDAGVWTEPGMELDEYGAYKNGVLDLDPAQQIEREYYQREAEKLYEQIAPGAEQLPATTNAIADGYASSGQSNEVIDYETITDIYYGYGEEGAYEKLTAEQKLAYDSWTELAKIHDMVDSYIRAYGERGIFTKRYLRQLNQQMNAIVKYDPDMGDRFWFGVTELFAGIGGFVESTLRFVTSAAFLAMGGVSYVFGAKEAAGEWVDTSRDVMGGSDIEEWRQKNRETFTATPRDEAAVSWAYMAGSMVPSLLLTAATGGLAASSVVSIANTWQEGTRQALKNGADYGTALLYGGAVGAMDATVSALTGGFGGKFKVGKKVVEFGTDALAKKAAGFLCKSEAGKYWVKLGLTALMEQPLSLMAMTAAPLLQRSMYDPDAELYTAEQITSAAVQGFLTRGLLEIAKDVPVFLKSIGGGKSLVDADADLPANLKRKIDGKLEDALKKAELGKAPEVEADPEQALRQMRQNTQAELGGKLELDIPDAGKNLATVLAADAELRGGGIRGAGEARLGLGETKPIDPESTYKVSVADDLPLKDVLARELGGDSTKTLVTNENARDIIQYKSSEEIPREIRRGKPKNSPAFERWYSEGGTVEYNKATQDYTYVDAEGYAVKYTGTNGKYPDFEDVKLKGEPVNVCGKKVELDGFTDRRTDKAKAKRLAGDSLSGDYVWHHKEDGHTLIQVRRDIHWKFTHKGGISLLK